MKHEYRDHAEGKADKEKVHAFLSSEIDTAVQRLPEDLRPYITDKDWVIRYGRVGGYMSSTFSHVLFVRFSYKNNWSETRLPILKAGTVNHTRLDDALLGLAYRKRGRETSANVKADNVTAWEQAGSPGRGFVHHTSSPDRYALVIDAPRTGLIFSREVTLHEINLLTAIIERTVDQIKAVKP